MKNYIIALSYIIFLQGCVTSYELKENSNTTTLLVEDIYLPEYKGGLILGSLSTLVSFQSATPECPFDGGFSNKNHLGDVKLTKSAPSKTINIPKNEPLYVSYIITELVLNMEKVCKSSLRIDPVEGKAFKLSVNGKDCTAAFYESDKGKAEFIRSDRKKSGEFRDERLCL